jgi:hypothetical protein
MISGRTNKEHRQRFLHGLFEHTSPEYDGLYLRDKLVEHKGRIHTNGENMPE